MRVGLGCIGCGVMWCEWSDGLRLRWCAGQAGLLRDLTGIPQELWAQSHAPRVISNDMVWRVVLCKPSHTWGVRRRLADKILKALGLSN